MQLELNDFAQYKLAESGAGTSREVENRDRGDTGGDSEMTPSESERDMSRASASENMPPPSTIPQHRREATNEGQEPNNPGTNTLPRPPITRQDPSVPAGGLPAAQGLEGRPGGSEAELDQAGDDPMEDAEDENKSGFDRASFRARNFGGPDSEDEGLMQDAVAWNPGNKPAKPTSVVRKAVIDDLWNKRGQLCRDWWERAGTRLEQDRGMPRVRVSTAMDGRTLHHRSCDAHSMAEGNRLGTQLQRVLRVVDGFAQDSCGE